ncbi:MAG: hypothetical protein ACP5O3_04575 [Candidatus Micrarchaeia archaeon]
MEKITRQDFLPFVAVVVLLSLVEVGLIIFGVLPPVLSYSLGNLLFTFAVLAVIVYAGIIFASLGLKKVALKGAALGFASTGVLCAAALLSSVFFKKPVLGLPAPNAESLALMLALVVIENAVLGAAVAALAAFLAKSRTAKRK